MCPSAVFPVLGLLFPSAREVVDFVRTTKLHEVEMSPDVERCSWVVFGDAPRVLCQESLRIIGRYEE